MTPRSRSDRTRSHALLRLTTTVAVLAIGLAGLLAPSAPAQASAPQERTVAARSMAGDALAVINRTRARKGCRALSVSPALSRAALLHSRLMGQRGRLSHQLSGEAGLTTRVVRAGYTRPTRLGETIAMGPTTGAGAVSRWMRSSQHRAILLDCRFRHAGIGVVGGRGTTWWTVDVGRR